MKKITEEEAINVNGGWMTETYDEIKSHMGRAIGRNELKSFIGQRVIIKTYDNEYSVGTLQGLTGGKRDGVELPFVESGEIWMKLFVDGGHMTWDFTDNLYTYVE